MTTNGKFTSSTVGFFQNSILIFYVPLQIIDYVKLCMGFFQVHF